MFIKPNPTVPPRIRENPLTFPLKSYIILKVEPILDDVE